MPERRAFTVGEPIPLADESESKVPHHDLSPVFDLCLSH